MLNERYKVPTGATGGRVKSSSTLKKYARN